MDSFYIAVKVCYKSILITACLFAGLMVFVNVFEAFLGVVYILVGGFIVSLLLCAFMIALINWSAKLPYKYQARLAWIVFWLAAVVMGVPGLCMRDVLNDPGACRLIGTTIAGIILAVYFTRRSFSNYYTKKDEIR